MSGHNKSILKIAPLKTIEVILSDFEFLEYGTRKRNLAYQVQYLEFKIQVLKNYSIYGSIRGAMLRDIVITVTNIMEYILFTSLCAVYGEDPKNHKFPSMIGQARRKGLISRNLAADMNKIDELRNKLHPSRQKSELDVKCFTAKDIDLCENSFNSLRNELEMYFKPRGIEVQTENETCPYKGRVELLFDDDICLWCGRIHD